MAENYVEILVKSKDDAKPDLDALKARLEELKNEVATARADVDDEAAAAKLDALQAKLLNLDKKTANPKISMSGALSAEAQIHAVEAAMKSLDRTAADGGPGWKSRASGFAQAAASITGIGDAIGVANPEASMFQKVMSGAGLATGLFEPVVAGATVAVGGLASGLAAGGAGLGVFGAVAKGVFSQVQGAVTSYETATSTTGKASATAMKKYEAQLAALPPAQQAVAKAIIGADSAWQDFVARNTAGVGKIMSQGIGLLPKVFAAMQPFLGPTEKALGDIIDKLGKGLDSSGFKSFVSVMAQNSGPAIEKIATAIGHVVVGIGGILKAFMPVSQSMLSGIDKITEKFAKWGSTLSQHSGFQSLMQTFKTETPLAMGVLKNLAEVIKNVAAAMTGLSGVGNSKTLLQVLMPLSGILASLSKNQDLDRIALYLLAAASAGKKLGNVMDGLKGAFGVVKTGASAFQDLSAGFSNSAAAASSATGIWGTFGGKISTAITAVKEWGIWSKIAAAATKVWTGIQIAFDAVMDANPIALIIIGIAALIAVIVLIATKTRWFQDIWNAAWGFIKKAFDDVFGWIKSHWPLLLAILTGPIGLATLFIVKHWNQILSGAEAMIHAVTSWFTRLPGMILHAVGNLGHLLWNAGVSLLEGLLHGIESMAGRVIGYVEHLASNIGGAFSSILHIFSPSKVFEQHGKMIAAGLIQGMDGSRGLVTSAAGRLATSTLPSAYPAGTGRAGAGGPLVIQIQAGAGGSGLDQMFMTWLKNSVRTGGGDPRMFNKKVQFTGA